MKKFIFSIVAMAALTSCAKEETISRTENAPIAFETPFVENATRATDVNKSNLNKFGVYASVENAQEDKALILTNELITRNGDAYGYTNTQYWVPGNKYYFTAFAPMKADNTNAEWVFAPTNGTAHNGTLTFNNAAAQGDVDLVYAYNKNEEVVAGVQYTVPFTFDHLLSKVAFKFTNAFAAANNITFEVKDVKITNAVSKADVAVATGVVGNWVKSVVEPVTFERAFAFGGNAGSTVISAGANKVSDHHYIIPVTPAHTHTITFNVDVYQAGVLVANYSHTVPTTHAFAKGGNYCLSTVLNSTNINPAQQLNTIEFTVSEVNGWNPDGTTDTVIKEPATSNN